MNIYEYIEKYSTIDIDKKAGLITVTMEVPQRKQITYKHEECEASQKMKVRTNDVQNYLMNSGMEIMTVKKIDSINNNMKLNALWKYGMKPVSNKKKRKTKTEEVE